jgi:predicted nucleic acid-binding protein
VFIFDTDVISHLIRREPPVRLISRIAAVPPEDQYTTSITVGELVYGAHRSARPDHFLRLLDERVWPNLQILPFDDRAARRYGVTRADLEKAGRPLPEPDLRIASIALAHDAVLVTGNVRHFGRIPGLRVESWL